MDQHPNSVQQREDNISTGTTLRTRHSAPWLWLQSLFIPDTPQLDSALLLKACGLPQVQATSWGTQAQARGSRPRSQDWRLPNGTRCGECEDEQQQQMRVLSELKDSFLDQTAAVVPTVTVRVRAVLTVAVVVITVVITVVVTVVTVVGVAHGAAAAQSHSRQTGADTCPERAPPVEHC